MLPQIGELVFACPRRILHAFWCSKGTLGYAPRCRRASDASKGQYLVQAGDFVDIQTGTQSRYLTPGKRDHENHVSGDLQG